MEPAESAFDDERDLTAGMAEAMRRVERYVANRIDNPADAADIAQESLARVIARAREIEITRLDFYALTIARNLVNDHHRGRRSMSQLDDCIACAAPIADHVLYERQRFAAVCTVVDAMPTLRREVFVRRTLHGQSCVEIEAALGLSNAAVKKHVSRARFHLVRALDANDCDTADM